MMRVLGRRLACLVLSVAASSAAASPARGTDYPDRAVRIIVGFSPGGATDQLARLLAKDLNEIWNQPVVVENHPGASGNIAHGQVAHSPGDGHTLLFTSAPLTINPSLYRHLDYDTLRDFKPVMLVAIVPSLLLVPAASPLKSFGDLLTHAAALDNALARAGTRSRIEALGLRISGAGPNKFQDFLAGELLKWADVVKRSGARVD